MSESQSMFDFLVKYPVKMTAERTDSNPHMDDSENMDHWKVKLTLRINGTQKSLTTYFSMGYGHRGQEPTTFSVLDCLASDASSVEHNNFDNWASDMGFDTDSRKAERIYKTCERSAEKLKRFLGDDAYNSLLWHTERE